MKTLVVKIGTSTLTRGGVVDAAYIEDLAAQVAALRAQKWRVVIVSSGAIRIGLDTMGRKRAVRLAEKQAAAAVGQSLLMRAYQRAFDKVDLHVAQLLLTHSDLSDRRRFLYARHTMSQLFKWGVVPIVNENDTVATEEIRFGDNDTLASLSALVAEADLVLLLSDKNGFYLPGHKAPIPIIEHISQEIEDAAGGAGSIGGTGGMRTKIEAARIATQAGIELVIAHGRAENIVRRVACREAVGTRFTAHPALRGRKRWIAFSRFGRPAQGTLVLDDRARRALAEQGSSLLPIGILAVEGDFDIGALVALSDSAGEYARGLTNFSSDDLRRIKGLHSSQISKALDRPADEALGRPAAIEAVHRDKLTLLHPHFPTDSEEHHDA